MARLTRTQLDRQIERKREEALNLKKKREEQEKKMLYGENWKKVLQDKLLQDIEFNLGSSNTPKLYDFKDIYEFFDPIIMYKDEENKPYKLDYNHFEESEKKYENILKKINQDLEKSKEENDDSKQQSELSVLERDTFFDDDGVDFEKETNKDIVKERNNKKSKVFSNISKYLNRYIPVYNKYICSCCGTPRVIDSFFISNNINYAGRLDNKGNLHMHICKECVQKLFAYYYEKSDKKVEVAMQYLCAALNLYWDIDLFYQSQKSFEEKGRTGTLIGSYITKINRESIGLTFMDSPFLSENYERPSKSEITSEEDYDWSKEDYRNKKTVIKMVGYDPFDYEKEEDRKILYRDLLNLLDEGMENDFVKFQAGLNIVQSFFKIRQISEKQARMEREDAPLNDQKALADLKAKELKSITDFSRDNGFSERYAAAKAKGEQTLTGIMNKMNEQKYENAILNRYDIETSETIQQAANASFKAIFTQLGLGESEVWKITQDQFEELTKLRKENSRLEEENRKLKYRVSEVNLKEKEREKLIKMGLYEPEEDV